MPCRATQDGQVMVESYDKMWSTEEGNGKPLQYSWTAWKGKKHNNNNNNKKHKIYFAVLSYFVILLNAFT